MNVRAREWMQMRRKGRYRFKKEGVLDEKITQLHKDMEMGKLRSCERESKRLDADE